MRYLLLITTDTAVPATAADADGAPDVERWWRCQVDAGRYVLGDPLAPAAQAVTVRVRSGAVSAIEGPFSEACEQIAGLDVIEAETLADAVEIASGHPMAHTHAVEVRAFAPMG
jgi:hypothetical protein